MLGTFLARRRLTSMRLRESNLRRSAYARAAGFFTRDFLSRRIMAEEGASNVRISDLPSTVLVFGRRDYYPAPSIVLYRKNHPRAVVVSDAR